MNKQKANSNSKTVQTEQATYDLSIVNPNATALVTAKRVAANAVDADVRSLGSIFSSLRRNRAETQAAIEEAVSKGVKLDKSALHEMLNVGNFNLFRSFLTEKESEKTKFSGSQGYNILFRAASTSKAASEKRAAIAQS